MRKALFLLFLLIPFVAHAQVRQGIRRVDSLPATCVASGGATADSGVLYQGDLYICTATNTWTKAVTQTTFLPNAAGTVDLGSTTLPFKDIYFAGSSGTPATNQFKITGASTSGVRTITFPDESGTVAMASLDNLASVAINSALLPAAAAGLDFGSTAKPWKDIWFAGSSGTPGTNQFKITGASTGGVRTITFPDASITVARSDAAQTLTGNQTVASGDAILSTAGKSISVKTGANACAGVATLNTGTVTVSTTCVGAAYGTDYAIILTPKGSSTGVVRVSTVTASTSFVITSTDGASADNVAWWIIKLT